MFPLIAECSGCWVRCADSEARDFVWDSARRRDSGPVVPLTRCGLDHSDPPFPEPWMVQYSPIELGNNMVDTDSQSGHGGNEHFHQLHTA